MDQLGSIAIQDDTRITYQPVVYYESPPYYPEYTCHDGLAHTVVREVGQGTDMTIDICRCIRCGKTWRA